jgi:N-acetyl-anhydromuramyl-L-alanine amidase AmpD
VLAAFQRHFRPAAVTGEADGETAAKLDALLAQLDDVVPEA